MPKASLLLGINPETPGTSTSAEAKLLGTGWSGGPFESLDDKTSGSENRFRHVPTCTGTWRACWITATHPCPGIITPRR